MIRSKYTTYDYDVKRESDSEDGFYVTACIESEYLVSFETLNEVLDNFVNLDYMKISSPRDVEICSKLISKSCLVGPALYIYTNDKRLTNLPSKYIINYSPDYNSSFIVYNRRYGPTTADGIQRTDDEYQIHPKIKKMAMELIVSDTYHV